jgi:hypothetical protein
VLANNVEGYKGAEVLLNRPSSRISLPHQGFQGNYTLGRGAYEGQRLQQSLTQTFSVPSEALRHGTFAGLAPIMDPLTGKPFPDNQIPFKRLDPAAVALLSHVALPNTSGQVQNLNAVGNEVNPMNQFTLRVDHRAGLNDNLFGRFIAYDVTDHQPFGTSSLSETLVPGFGRVVTTSSRSLALSETHTFRSTVLNEARFGPDPIRWTG